jgi:hypothetical protein
MSTTASFLFCALVNLACAVALGTRAVVLDKGSQPLILPVAISMAVWCVAQAVIA